MSRFTIMFSRMVRETAEVKIEAASKEEAKAKALKLYQDDEDEPGTMDNWISDFEYGAEAGIHFVLTDELQLIPFTEIADVKLPEDAAEDAQFSKLAVNNLFRGEAS